MNLYAEITQPHRCEYLEPIRGKDKEEISDGENKEGIWPKCSSLLPCLPCSLIHFSSKEIAFVSMRQIPPIPASDATNNARP